MEENKRSKEPPRKYPVMYERLIPLALGLIVIFLLALLVIIFGVALGSWVHPT